MLSVVHIERTIAQDRSRTRELFWQLLIVRLVLGFVAIFALTTAAAAVGYERIIVICVGLNALTYLFAAVLAPLTSVFASHERYDLWTGAMAFGQIGGVRRDLVSNDARLDVVLVRQA